MREWTQGFVVAAALLACGPQTDPQTSSLLKLGRQYTAWLYGSQYEKLWNRFSPDMRQTFGSVGDLASFEGQAVTRLGRERGQVGAPRLEVVVATAQHHQGRVVTPWREHALELLAQRGDVDAPFHAADATTGSRRDASQEPLPRGCGTHLEHGHTVGGGHPGEGRAVG